MAEATENKSTKKNYYASEFASIAFFGSMLLFFCGFFIGTKSMDFTALRYAIKQVVIPAFIVGYMGFLTGRFLDKAKIKRKVKSLNKKENKG